MERIETQTEQRADTAAPDAAAEAADRAAEESFLAHTLTRLEDMVGELERKLVVQAAQIEELYGIYTIDDPEYYTVIPVAEQIGNQYQADLAGIKKMAGNPYFGKVVFTYEDSGEGALMYIGKKAVLEYDPAEAGKEPPIVDWRAPVADVYYSCKLGKTSYRVPVRTLMSAAPEEVGIDLHLKRTLRIREGRLESIYDADVIANDDMLMEYLSQNKGLVLGEIIATIQDEQNSIIRRPFTRNLVVQGVAGSGKTTVAIHRISYLLYSFKEVLTSDNVLLVAANPLFLSYITGMLPDLDVPVIRQATMEALLLDDYREFVSKKTPRLTRRPAGEANPLYADAARFRRELEALMAELENEVFAEETVTFLGTVLMPAPEMRMIKGRRRPDLLTKAAEMDGIIEKAIVRQKEKIIESISWHKKDPAVQAAARERFRLDPDDIWEFNLVKNFGKFKKSYKNYFTKRVMALDPVALSARLAGRGEGAWTLADLACCQLLLRRFRGEEKYRAIRHIVIDEAQDFGPVVYACLQTMFPGATFTIVGDIMQNIEAEGMDDWSALEAGEAFYKPADLMSLHKSYRNTFEITAFARETVEAMTGRPYEVDPLKRPGEAVAVEPRGTDRERMDRLRRYMAAAEDAGCRLNAVICFDREEVKRVLTLDRKAGGGLRELSGDAGSLEYGTYVLDVRSAKGLEFDAVAIWDFDRYTAADVKPLYVAMTRALHRLAAFSDRLSSGGTAPEDSGE